MTARANYREQDGCWTCRHAFEKTDYGSTAALGDFYCTLDAPPRPPCGSRALGDARGYDPEVWLAWAQATNVEPAGICAAWQEWEKVDTASPTEAGILAAFYADVCKEAEGIMAESGMVSGAHWNAMKRVLSRKGVVVE